MAQQETAEPARAQAIVPLLDYQREDVESDARFRWNCWARQTGKSFTKSLRRILRGLARRRTQIFLSAGERQCRELMQKAREHCQALKIANDYYDNRFFKDLSIKQLEGPVPVAPAVPFAAGLALSRTPDGEKRGTGLLPSRPTCESKPTGGRPIRRRRAALPATSYSMSLRCTHSTARSGRLCSRVCSAAMVTIDAAASRRHPMSIMD